MAMQVPEVMADMDKLAGLGELLFKSCLARMESARKRGDIESALEWAGVASYLQVYGGSFGELISLELEKTLKTMAAPLPAPVWQRHDADQRRVLHVLTEAYRIFGHTKLCRKWIELDAKKSVHNVVLLYQGVDIPENLVQTVQGQGGFVKCLDRSKSVLERAEELRRLAYESADVVVLHVHPEDVLPCLAFSAPGGPPVVYVNHADHAFWVGGTITDLVLDIRESGNEWTRNCRGIDHARILPIPLDEETTVADADSLRTETRKKLGIPADATMFLTVGNARKYQPMLGISFMDAASAILEASAKNWIVAVGPKLEGAWEQVSKTFQGRLLAVGNQNDLRPFHRAADVYLEGVPIGSLTALLEAGLAGLPCVGTPAVVKPPFVSDGAALGFVARPLDVAGYVQAAVSLAADPNARKERGEKLRRRIIEVHCDRGWTSSLVAGMAAVPEVHRIHNDLKPARIDRDLRNFWLGYLHGRDGDNAGNKILTMALRTAIHRCPDVLQALETALFDQRSTGVRNESGLKRRIVEAIFSEAGKNAEAWGIVPETIEMDIPQVFVFLLSIAASAGRARESRLLALRACFRWPGLLRSKEFRNCVLKVWVGRTVIGALKKMKPSAQTASGPTVAASKT
jgi:hypothetical protein